MRNPLTTLFPNREAVHGPLDDFWYSPAGQVSHAGVDVTIDNATQVSAVYGCVRVLRETLGHLPFCVYHRTGQDSREKATDNYLWKVLHDRPNRWQTPMAFKELGVNHLLLRGNFYCLLMGNQDSLELWPLNPDRMEVKQNGDGDMRYHYHRQAGDVQEYAQEDIYHVMGQSLNGVSGVGVIEYARNTIGSTIAQEKHGASLFKNGALPPYYIWRPPEKKWTDVAIRNFRRGWRKLHGNGEGEPPIMSDGMEIRELSISNRDSQWIESRGLSAEEICRFFGVSPHMIGVQSTAPKGNTEQQALEFSMYTLAPLATRFEEAANRDLVQDPDTYFTKFNLDATCRADTKTRHEAHNIAVQGGWKTINEVRALENLNPQDGGNELRFPMNMQPAGGGPDEIEQGGQPGKGSPKPAKQQELPDEAKTHEVPKKTQADAEPTANAIDRDNQRRAARASFAILLDGVADRLAGVEINSLRKRSKQATDNHEKWCAWASSIYVLHAGLVVKAVMPICAAWDAVSDESHAPDMNTITSRLCSNTEAVFDAQTDIPALLETWKTTRAGELAAILKEEFFNENL